MRTIFAFITSLFFIAFSSIAEAKTILVTGGAGYIGSYVNERLYREGYDTVILDNLSNGFEGTIFHGTLIHGDLSDKALLEKIFSSYEIDAVMHFAASIEVGESVNEPLKYYQNNTVNTINLLEAMVRHNVDIFIFSSTAAVYGTPIQDAITEDHPTLPINPYGESKLTVEKVLRDCEAAYGLRYTALRYFNAAGGDPEGLIKDYKTYDSHLIPIAINRIESNRPITVYGNDYATRDGTCIRDYIHVDDIASAHIAAMERLFNGGSSTCYNLGSGSGFSVLEVIAAVERVVGKKCQMIEGDRRPGDPEILVACSKKAQEELGWTPRLSSLETMIKHYWNARKH